jgi:hypothetical protein
MFVKDIVHRLTLRMRAAENEGPIAIVLKSAIATS